MATYLLEARMEPAQLYTPVVALPLPLPRRLLTEHRALSIEHTGHGALGKASDVSSTPRPLYSNFRTHSTLPRYSPALQTR